MEKKLMIANMDISFDEMSALHSLLEKHPKIGTPDCSMSLNSLYAKVRNKKYVTIDPNKTVHPTEQKYPEQTKRFREILDEMYQTHLKKNADYSAWNILATGEVGLTVRFWDKCARLMNLMGFDIGTGRFTGPKKNLVEDESVLDTVMDAGVYAIIFKIHNEGKWGK